MRRVFSIFLAAAVVSTIVACSSTTQQIRPRAPWEPELGQFFDDAVDFMIDPGALPGQWATVYAGELRGRVDAADLICRVHISTVREDISVEGDRRKHLIMTVSSTITGQEPPDGRLHLVVEDGAAGFDTIEDNVPRLLDNRFVAFVRWYEDDAGTVRSHWHLSPASRQVVQATRSALAERGEEVVGSADDEDD